MMSPKYEWALDYFGGRNYCKDFASSSNIIFSNGEYDPWHGGGVLDDCMVNNKVIFMKKSAHHLDLRTPNSTVDPPDVTAARETEIALITKWIESYQNQILVQDYGIAEQFVGCYTDPNHPGGYRKLDWWSGSGAPVAYQV
jgi:hypothetical protein